MQKYLFTLLASFIGLKAYSQSVQIILADDIAQGEQLLEAYFTPMAESFGVGLNTGWYNTAKPHSLGGFDLTFTINTVIIPNSAKTFNIKDAGGNIFVSDETEASTIFGSKETTTMYYESYSVDIPNGFSREFEMPGGFNTSIVPIPMIQAGIGLVKKTDLSVRYMPMMNVGDNINVNLLGVGLKHDLLQWIPQIGNTIPMSLSLQWGYTTLNTELKIAGQKVSLNTKANTINLIASKKLLLLTGYAGVGYNSSNTTFAADANFDLGGVKFNEKIDVKFESNNNIRANVGLRFNITLFTIQADYTFSTYPTASLGIGISLR